MIFFKTKCPKCKSTDIGKIHASFATQLKRMAWIAIFWPLALFMGFKKPQMVCRSCGFTWEQR